MRNKLLSLLVLLLIPIAPAFAQIKRGPSTDEERTKALAGIEGRASLADNLAD
jgi:hypothetical protein